MSSEIVDLIEKTWTEDPRKTIKFNHGRFTCHPDDVTIDQFLTYGDKPFGDWVKEESSPAQSKYCSVNVEVNDNGNHFFTKGEVGLFWSPDLTESMCKTMCLYLTELAYPKDKVIAMHIITDVEL